MKVLKFGGSSINSAENIEKVREIVLRQNDDVVVVVSGLGGVTELILKAAKTASTGSSDYLSVLEEINEKHKRTVADVFNSSGPMTYIGEELLDDLVQILTGITLVGELTLKTLKRIEVICERL